MRQWAVNRFTFFVGKGGVGKTTISSAYSLHRAATEKARNLLLLSTDPAHSLADLLQTRLGDKAKRLRTPGRVWARQLDARRQIDRFLRNERRDLLDLLNRGSLFTTDELEPLLDTSLPGMAEVAALLAIHELLDSDFDEIVVDTAPMGHAIRLFQMPEHFARFLEVLETAASRDVVLAQHFGGHVRREPALERWSSMVDRVRRALSAQGSKLVLVTTPEIFSLNEAARSAEVFEGTHARLSEIVLNRIVEATPDCARCRRLAGAGKSARVFLAKHFPRAKLWTALDRGCPIFGAAELRQFGAQVFAGAKAGPSLPKPPKARAVEFALAEWPQLQTPLTLTLGKGGVGKTTISAALAFHQRRSDPNDAVTICSIDPAPSLDDVFATQVDDQLRTVLDDPKLRAAELDATAEFQAWAGKLRARLTEAMTGEERGVHLDLSLDRRFLLALLDIVPPGVDEIFASFRMLDLLDSGSRVVIDMAPTGHALEVLRTPERMLAWTRVLLKTLAAHRTLPFARDAAGEVAMLSQRVRELAAILRDGKRCGVIVVTLPEPLPDHETRRLLQSLREMHAPLGSVFVNRVNMDEAGPCRRCRREQAWQRASLVALQRQLRGTDVYIAREFEASVSGRKGLERFTSELWRLR